jgi:hypothetical protein
MDKHTIATQLVCAWLRRTEVNNLDSGEKAARETGDYIAWVFLAVLEGLEEEAIRPTRGQRASVTPMNRAV